ncbi:hypothetical protein D3C80_1779460 [compost metagenome]
MMTWPRSVNLMALLTRFETICLTRSGSNSTSTRAFAAMRIIRVRFFWRAKPSNTCATDSTSSARLTRSGAKDRCPDSMRAMSRMSPIKASRSLAEL